MAKKKTETTTKQDSYPKIADIRLEQLKYIMEDHKVDALVVTYLPNIRYLTNFSGSTATLFITPDEIYFVTDDRYEEQVKTELYPLPGLQEPQITRDPFALIADKKILPDVVSMAFEADKMTYDDAVKIRNQVRPVKFKPAPNMVEPFTVPKADEELAYIKEACRIAEATYEKILEFVKPGVTEKELALEITYQSRLLGSEGDPFDIIVTSGDRGALVHGQPSDKEIEKGDIVLFDFGCKVHGFGSDISRTIAVGKATKEQKANYDLLYKAKEAAIEFVRPAMNAKNVDAVARKIIEEAGYGDNFKHSLGHGIGLVAHEHPIITFRLESEMIPENSVLAIEPGIYLPGKYGMRIEDNILVTRNGGVHLTNAPKKLPII
jgi:Xaa-Pro aminopeptidase